MTSDLSDSSLLVEVKGNIANVAAALAGSAVSVQKVGLLDVESGSSVNVSLRTDSITGVGAAVAGSSRVTETLGVVSGQRARDVAVGVKAGAISGTGVGVLGKGTASLTVGVVSAQDATSVALTENIGSVTTIAAGINSSSEISVGTFNGGTISSDTMAISAGSIKSEAYGIGAKSYIDIGEFDGVSNLSGYINLGNVYAHSISAWSDSTVRIGYDVQGGTGSLTMNITVGDIDNKVDVAGGASSKVYVGTLLQPIYRDSLITINTGDISSYVAAALGGTNGVFVGNINNKAGARVEVHTGSQHADAVACVGHIGCLSELVGKKNCIMIGNVGMEADCGNESLIGDAVKELEHLGYEVEQGFVKAGKAIANTVKDIGKGIKHFFSGW